MAPPKTWTVRDELLRRRKKIVPIPTREAYESWSLDQLKLECTSRKLNAVKNTNKEGRVALLNAYDMHKLNTQNTVQQQRSNARRGREEEEKRTKNCMFRLLNVLFSESFFNGLLTSGNQLSRSELDQGGSTFWGDVATAFSEADVLYDTKVSSDAIFDDIDPSQTVVHSGAKLHRMWREVSSNFARAEAGSKKSGEHGEDFWSFCAGRADVFYLHKWCEHRGAGREFCSANIYSDNEDDSQKEGASRGKKGNRKRRNSSQAEILASLAESVDEMAAANESSEAQEATWKEQALLLREKRIWRRLEMLHTIVERTNGNIFELKKHLQEHKDDSDEDEFDAEELLVQERSKHQRLMDQIEELEHEVVANVQHQQML
ncbi:hypothetical protein F442_23208 [Phytophthora nicotianae P10297]|uniref:Uncharacterized protein n=1 Tax=Phytophthora nicotianae P10297 TaxID=1317064 RepID=W2XYQ3_PHYNI|nr:hypothetical protein F442_23208 [Phytophthora nicotianae P10297]